MNSRHNTAVADKAKGLAPDLGIADAHRQTLGKTLNTLLADEFLLYTKTRNYHWNVTGESFPYLHKVFEEQYEALNVIVDEVAERCRALGERALGSLHEFVKASRLRENPEVRPDAKAMIADLLRDYESLIKDLRVDAENASRLGDTATNNFLVGILEKHEKTAWMLRACLEK